MIGFLRALFSIFLMHSELLAILLLSVATIQLSLESNKHERLILGLQAEIEKLKRGD